MLPSIFTLLEWYSTPSVTVQSYMNSLVKQRWIRQLLPLPESPTTMTLNTKSLCFCVAIIQSKDLIKGEGRWGQQQIRDWGWISSYYGNRGININKRMILNPTDPSGIGLFSRCARNQALKAKPHRPTTATRSRAPKSTESARKKSITFFGFDKQQSRQQRQGRYMRSEAPPVGQYNPVRQDRPKMVWDILKAHQHQLHKKSKPVSSIRENKMVTVDHGSTPQSESELQGALVEQTPHQNMISLGEHSSMMASSKSQCMVDMSRTTGRKQKPKESVDWGDVNIMDSVRYVKGTITKNVSFDKQTKPQLRQPQSPASNYSYDFNVIKSRRNGLLDFSVVKGRQQKVKVEDVYAYQHYQYNSYVWQSNSRVFPNTKTHIIEFKKQTNRYRQQRQERA